MMLLNMPIRAVLLQIGREPINLNNDDEYYKALKSRQEVYTKKNDTKTTIFSTESTVAVQMEAGGSWMHDVRIEGNSKDHKG